METYIHHALTDWSTIVYHNHSFSHGYHKKLRREWLLFNAKVVNTAEFRSFLVLALNPSFNICKLWSILIIDLVKLTTLPNKNGQAGNKREQSILCIYPMYSQSILKYRLWPMMLCPLPIPKFTKLDIFWLSELHRGPQHN